ncbi:hypothetical protein [Streptomyces pratensis]|uniref:hypothetical protein n=1 Tax=Streptomyces pratensis TaxID=1169025 RepID=UPI00301982A1
MGWTVLYIAFGLVALWLLGEVLLQYKARLRWRLLAFAGFLGVVVGVLLSSQAVIVLGTLTFATGQTFVTLSFRRGFSTGWAIGGSPGESRRRKRGRSAAVKEPTLEVSDLEIADHEHGGPATGRPAEPGHEPGPQHEESGQYGLAGQAAGEEAEEGQRLEPHYAAYDSSAGFGQQAAQDAYAGAYDYGTEPQSYAAYSDPYIGTTNGTPAYGGYDGYAETYDNQDGGRQHVDLYAQSYGTEAYSTDTPPGGVWVPLQRDFENYPPPMPPMPPEQPAPYGNGHDTGPNEQYRY